MRLKAGIVAAAILALGLTGQAHAQWKCGLGAGLGGSLSTTDTSTSFGPVGVDVNGLGGHSTQPDASIRGECGFLLSRLYVGAVGEYTWQDVKFGASITAPGGGASMSAALGDGYMIGGKVGVAFGDAMPYVIGGYRHVDASWSFSPALPAGAVILPSSFSGPTVGGGVEFTPFPSALPNLKLGPEVMFTHYDVENIAIKGFKPGVDVQPDQLQGMLRATLYFGPAPAAGAPQGYHSMK